LYHLCFKFVPVGAKIQKRRICEHYFKLYERKHQVEYKQLEYSRIFQHGRSAWDNRSGVCSSVLLTKQMQALAVDIETKVLADLDEKLHGLTQVGVHRRELIKIISNVKPDWSPEVAFTYHILYTLAHAFHMRQRKLLSNNEWTGWLRWMRAAFKQGMINEIWKNNIEAVKWFDPAFQGFTDMEIRGSSSEEQIS
jgi:hypothetical protein